MPRVFPIPQYMHLWPQNPCAPPWDSSGLCPSPGAGLSCAILLWRCAPFPLLTLFRLISLQAQKSDGTFELYSMAQEPCQQVAQSQYITACIFAIRSLHAYSGPQQTWLFVPYVFRTLMTFLTLKQTWSIMALSLKHKRHGPMIFLTQYRINQWWIVIFKWATKSKSDFRPKVASCHTIFCLVKVAATGYKFRMTPLPKWHHLDQTTSSSPPFFTGATPTLVKNI